MVKSKTLRILSIILEASFLGSIILYAYNYYVARKKYDVFPAQLKGRLNIFIIIAIVSFILFLIVKYALYLRNKVIVDNNEQLQLDLDDVVESKPRDLEAPITERVFIYKNEYEVPKERIAYCKNCGSIVDKNAHICLKCGYLLKSIVTEKVVEKVITKPVYINSKERVYVKQKSIDKVKLTNILINLGLIIAILITLVMILNLASERGIIG